MCYEKYLGAFINMVKKKNHLWHLCRILKHAVLPHFIFQMKDLGIGIH